MLWLNSHNFRDIPEKLPVRLECILLIVVRLSQNMRRYWLPVASRLSSVYKRGSGEHKGPVHNVHVRARRECPL